jgi:hypothetical protein
VTHQAGGRGEEGASSVATILVMTLVLVFFVNLAQLVVWQYGRGSVRAALDEAARAGAGTAGGLAACEERADAVLRDLLGGSMGDEVQVSCRDDGSGIVAEASVVFRSWMPPMPDWTFTSAASAPFEPGSVGHSPATEST